MRVATVGTAVLLALSACGGSPAPRPSAPQPTTAPTLGPGGSPAPRPGRSSGPDCADPAGQADTPDASYRTLLGVVAVPSGRTLEVAPSGRSSPRLFAKWGLLVRTGQTVQVSVGDGWASRARVGWGSGVEPAASVRITACPQGSAPQPWTAFAGGTWLDKAACVPLVIRAGGRSVRLRMPVGVSCS